MEYINNELYLEFDEFVPSVMTKKNYDYHRGVSNIDVLGYGGNGRTVYIKYESLPQKHKAKVLEVYGCPYKYVLRKPLLNSIKHDQAAQDFYTNYVLPNGLKLPASDTDLKGKQQINYVMRYTTAANWLNMLQELTADKATLKKEFNVSVMEFWKAVFELIKIKKVKLPASRKHLLPKLKAYTENGYETLIETHKFGNSFSAKVEDKTSKAVLFGMLEIDVKFDNVDIALEYNKWAVVNNYKPITPEAVGYWRKKWKPYLYPKLEGIGKTNNTFSKKIKGYRPTAPLYLVNGDDNIFDAFFKNNQVKWYRPALYVVIDCFNDYILGYAIGHTITSELIQEAFRDANRHIREITKGNYSWHELL